MTSRVQASREPTVGLSQRGQTSTTLPEYECLEFPLNPAAQNSLLQLHRRRNLAKLEESLAETIAGLTNNVADINDRVFRREQATRKAHSSLSQRGDEDDVSREAQQKLDNLRNQVTKKTQEMESSLRRIIDVRQGVHSIKTALDKAAYDAGAVPNGTAAAPGTTQTRSHRPTHDTDLEDLQDFEPTIPTSTTQPYQSAISSFRQSVDESKTRYQSSSLAERYSQNTDYSNFKRSLHDACYPNDEVPLPPPHEWFPDGRTAAPGMTGRDHADDDSDDDIAIERAVVSTRCPVTLQEFKQPLTSKACPHSYESAAILEMLAQSTNRTGGVAGPRGYISDNERKVRCPVGGCNQWITRNLLHEDPVLIRKIRRLQRAREMDEEDDVDDRHRPSTQGRSGMMVGDEDDADGDAMDVDALAERQTQSRRPKEEVRSSAEPDIVDEEGEDEDGVNDEDGESMTDD